MAKDSTDLAATDSELAPLFARFTALNNEGKFREELKTVIEQLGQAVTDLVAHIEDNDPKAVADKLVTALGALKMPAPQVNVSPQVTVEATMPAMPAPVIHLVERERVDETWEIRIKGQFGAADKVMTITRKASGVPQAARTPAPKRLAS